MVVLSLKGPDMALALGLLIAVVAGTLVALLTRASGWKWGAALGAVFVALAAYLDFTTDLGPDVVAPSLAAAAATKIVLDRVLEKLARASPS